jgi:chloramphenicol-sensitive protein RarD
MPASSTSGQRTGLAYGLAAYLAWGLLPLYFRALHGVPPLEILAHRIAWSVLLLAALTTWLRRWPEVARPLSGWRGRATLLATTGLITVNWGVYIWAVHAGRVLEASLGYFINPLVNVLLGVLFLGERLTRRQLLAVGLAGLGVATLVASAGALPWVALVLAVSFGFYGLLRTSARIDAVAGLFSETALLAPAAVAGLLWLAARGEGHLGAAPGTSALLVAAGAVTALPLIWFALGVQRLRLSTIGLLQYLAPTMQFSIAVFVFGEPFTAAHAVAFGCIWGSLALYTFDALTALRRVEGPAAPPAAASSPRPGAP